MRVWRWCLAIVCSLGLATTARAQTAITLDALRVELWPEYDQAAVLVILSGTLPASVIVPAEVTLTIPGNATVFAAAVQDANQGLLNATFSTTRQADKTLVKLTATARTFQLEYYDSSLKIVGAARTFAWQWQADYAAQQVTLRVQEPVGAANLATTPALQPTGAGDLGLSYREANLGPIAAGQALTLNLSYTKSSPQLSADAIGVTQPTRRRPVRPPTPHRPPRRLSSLPSSLRELCCGSHRIVAAASTHGRIPSPGSQPTPTGRNPIRSLHQPPPTTPATTIIISINGAAQATHHTAGARAQAFLHPVRPTAAARRPLLSRVRRPDRSLTLKYRAQMAHAKSQRTPSRKGLAFFAS